MGMGLGDWPAMRGWFERIRERPAVERAMAREDLKAPAKYVGRHQTLDEKEWSNMFGDANHAAVAKDRHRHCEEPKATRQSRAV